MSKIKNASNYFNKVDKNWLEFCKKIWKEATDFLSAFYGVPPEKMIEKRVKYLGASDEEHACLVLRYEWHKTKDREDLIAHEIHETAEALEMLNRYEQLFPSSSDEYMKTYRECHPIATEREIEYLTKVGRIDLVEKAKARRKPKC